ncbi:MAG: hypothetical protein ACRC8Y_10205, partial [Chroococcales cyanobacterium]
MGRIGEMVQVCSNDFSRFRIVCSNDFSRFRIVCSNDFSRCSRVMAEAMTRTLSGLSACLGTGSEAFKGALLGVKPSNAVTTEVVTTNVSGLFVVTTSVVSGLFVVTTSVVSGL